MSAAAPFTAAGGCTCRSVRYRLTRAPLIVHCCHCRWCQRETGSAFVLNALIESDALELESGRPELVPTPERERQGTADRALPAVPHRAVEPLRRLRRS